MTRGAICAQKLLQRDAAADTFDISKKNSQTVLQNKWFWADWVLYHISFFQNWIFGAQFDKKWQRLRFMHFCRTSYG